MYRILAIIFLTITQISYFMADPGLTKHALIIAIGNYPELSGWKSISSLNDVELIQSALGKQGFTDFTILRDSQASKSNILNAFNALKEKLRKGDILVVHFASHGQQILDDDGDEIDGFDEAIVAFGAPMRYDKAYEGENHLRDEELGEQLDEIRVRLGKEGDVMVLIDACHSGTGTRGEGVVRGGAPPFAPDHIKPKSDDQQLGIYEEGKVSTRGNLDNMAPMVVISAARADELNYEYKGFGSLSLAFNKSMENLNTEYSYRTLFSRIVKEMSVLAPRQTPAMEGALDRQLFGGKLLVQESYYELRQVDGNFIQIEGGQITGLHEGTIIEIYPSGTVSSKSQTPLASGTIGYSELNNATAFLDTELEGKHLDYWVFVKDRTFGDVRVKVGTSKIEDRSARKELNAFLESYELTMLSDTPEFDLISIGSLIQLIRVQDGVVYNEKVLPATSYNNLKETISAYAQGKFLKDLEISNSEFNIEIELIPIKLTGGKVDTLNREDFTGRGGMLEFREGDLALVRITNRGKYDVYFNIIDIQPDGIINPVMPDPDENENARDYRIAAGQSFVPRRKLSFFPPFGTETYKIFASYDPLDFRPIFRLKGQGDSRGLENPLEKLFKESYTMSRGTASSTLSSDANACTFSYTFRIVK